MAADWDPEKLMNMVRAFQPACVIMAGAELGLFDRLAERPQTAQATADALGCDHRGMRVLLDALAGIEVLEKRDGTYACAPGVAAVLTQDAPDSQLAMVRHLANCLRRWDQLPRVVKDGSPAHREPSVLGSDGDTESFIEAMNDVNRQSAPELLDAVDVPEFSHLLDVGGGPATWTLGFLERHPCARATLFDLPDVIPIARRHVEAAGLTERVAFVAGDLRTDDLPPGADLVWISAIVHMNSREQNRDLFRKAHAALATGGSVVIRDVIMDSTRTRPPRGALFAVNMLVATAGGGTFTFEELQEDLATAGFRDIRLLHEDPGMSSVVAGRKPA